MSARSRNLRIAERATVGRVVRAASRAITIAGSVCAFAVQPAHAECEYEVTIVEGPPGGICAQRSMIPTSINELGHVAGYHTCIGDSRAFVWTPETGTVTLPLPAGFATSRAFDISDSGDAVGLVWEPGPGLSEAVLWRGEEVTGLGIPPGGNWSTATGINEEGVICGTWGHSVTGPVGAFRWEDDQMTLLGVPFNARAFAINRGGQIAGRMNGVPSQGGEAFLWEDGSVRQLQTLPEAVGSDARALADNALVTGDVYLPIPVEPGFIVHAFLSEEGVMHDLGILSGHTECFGSGVNQLGEVVGRCWISGSSSEGFLYSHGLGMRSLNDVVAYSVAFVTGGAINDAGEIAARDWDGNLVVLRPERPATDLEGDCLTDEADLLVLLRDWREKFSPADIDEDGHVGFHDLMILLDGWNR